MTRSIYSLPNILSWLLFLLVLSSSASALQAAAELTQTDLFVVDGGEYKTYRIPSVAVSPQNTVLAFCAARKGYGDWDEIDIMLRRSLDGGKTWLKPQIVADAGKGTADNPTVIVDRQGRIHLLYQMNYSKGFYTYSDDEGATFAEPVDITACYEAYRDQYDWNVIAPGPGHGLQLKNDRLLIPIWLSTGGEKHRPSEMAVIYSDDRGQTWEPGPIIARHGEKTADGETIVNPSESSVAELADGRVLINIRSESEPYRRLLSCSSDGGLSWSKPTFHDELFEPICFGSMATLTNGDLLFANPDSQKNSWRLRGKIAARENLTLRLSRDGGQTWPIRRVLEPKNAGYSDLAVGPDGTIWCLYERGGKIFREDRITIARLDRAWLVQDSPQPERQSNSKQPPNIVFILVDDLGYTDLGCYGSDFYETPHIDSLAQEGMKFIQGYAASCVCSPTRASILTGKNPARLHITHAIPIEGHLRLEGPLPLIPADYRKNLPLEEVTIAESLQLAGYATAHIGKWHVSWDKAYYPEHQGFDVNIGGNKMGYPGTYFHPYRGRWRMTPQHPWFEWQTVSGGKQGEYLTDRLTDEALEFIDQHADEPFFLHLAHYAVHTPLEAPKPLIDKYRRKQAGKRHSNAEYAAMIESVDQSVGRVLTKLAELNLTDNTVVIFTSDNGGHGRVTSHHPLRGCKGNFYEGGIRVPLVVRWPGVVEANSTCQTPVMSPDIYPTLLEVAALPPMPSQHIDGLSLKPLLSQAGKLNERSLIWHFPNYIGVGHPNASRPVSIIRRGEWKLHEFLEDGRVELYHLEDDVGESDDLADDHPEVVSRLQQELAAWRDEASVQMPRRNPEYLRP